MDYYEKEDKWNFSKEERLQRAIKCKDDGNIEFKKQSYPTSISNYIEACDWCDIGIED